MKKLKLFFALFAMLALGVGNAWGQTVTWEKATSIAAGDVVALVCESKKMELSSISTSSTKYGIGTAYTSTPAGLYELTVEEGSSSGTFSFKNGSNYLYWTSGNSLATNTSKSANSSWKVTFSGETLTIVNAKDNTRKLQWNASSPRFACYTTNQTAVQLYKKVISEESEDVIVKTLESIEVTPKTTDYETGDVFKFDGTCTATYSVTKNGEPQDDETAVVTPTTVSTPDMSTAGTKEITVTYTEDDVTVTDKYNIIVIENVVTPGNYCITPNNTFWGTNYTGTNANAATTLSGKQDDISILHTKSGSNLYVNDSQTRVYENHTMKISVPLGYVITAVVFTADGTNWKGTHTADVGEMTDSKTWTGANQNVTITFGGTCRITNICVTYIKDVKYALTITEPTEGGTLVVKDGENTLASGAEIYEGTKLTVTATPETGYEDGVVVVKNASDEDVTADVYEAGTLTMPAYAVTISATFEKKPCELLAKPTVSATTTFSSATLTWEAVANAAKYSVTVGETTTEVTEPTFTATGLNAETTYTYQVQAIAEAEQDTYCDSEVAEGSFTTTVAPVATLTLSDIEGTTTQTGALNGTITLPTTAAECSKTFVGWDADANCNHAPTYAPGAEYTLAAETQTLYAVYADGEMGEASLTKMTSSDALANGDKIVIVANGTKLGMYQETISTSYVKNWELGAEEPTISELDEKKIWDVVAVDGSWKLGDATNGYLYNSSSNNLAVSITDASTWTIEWQEKGFTLKSNQNRYLACRTDLTSDKKNLYRMNGTSVSSTNGSVYEMNVYKYVEPAASYSNFSTTCAAAPKAEVTPTEVTATAAGVEGKVTVTYENVNTANATVALFDDEECGVVFTAGWLTASIDADKNITYTVAENTTYAERKAYIQLTAPETTGATDPAVVVVPVNQAAKDKVFASLEELVAADLTAGDEVTVTLNNDVIKEFYIYSSKRCGVVFDVQKDGKDIKIYFNNQTTIVDWAVGGKLSGTLTNVEWTTYSSAWQLAPDYNTWAWANLTYTEPKAVSTVVVSGAPTKTTYVDGETFDPAGLTVTVNYNDATTEVNPTGVTFTVTPTTLVKGQTSVSVTATFNSVTSAAYEVTGLTVNDIPTKTVAEFIAAGGTRCYLEGIVSDIDNTTYGNFNLTDASGTIYVYGCLNAAGESQKFAELGVKNGDKIKVIADEYEFYQNITPEAKDVQYVSHKSAATIEVADIAMEVGDTHTISATVTPADASITYAIKAGSDCITLNDDAEITAIAAGTATIVATIAETEDYMGAEKEITVIVTAVDTRKKAVSPSSFTATSGELSPNDITYTSYQGGAANAPGTYNNGIRLYQISSGTYGGYITLTAVKGCLIDQVEITTTEEYETTTVAYSVDDNVTLLGSASVAQLSKYSTPVGLNTESVNILNLGTTKNNRLEIASITVYYTGQPLADPELSWTSNAVELRVGEAFTAPTLNNPYNVTGITYRSDNELLAKVNETTGAVTLVPDATGTATITAEFEGNDTYKAVAVSYTITVKHALVYGVWDLVTDHTTLAAGDKVIIVAKDDDYALSTTQNSNNRGRAAVTKNSDNNTVAFGKDVQVLTLETGTVDNTFALNTGNGYLYASSTSSNQLKTQAKKDDNASWNISIADGTATIVAKGSNTRNTMQYNQSSSLFACYASASQKALCLYMKKNVKVEGETDNTSIPNQSDVTVDHAELTVTTEAEYDNMYIGNNGSVDVEETVTVNNLYIQTTMGTTTSGQLNTAPENLIVNGDAFIDITLGKNGDPSQWHAFTVPFPVDAMNGVYDLNDKKLTNGVNYAIMQYHGNVRAQGKYGWKKYSGVLVPGTFYLMTVDGERTTYRFKKVKDADLVAANTKSLSAYTGGGKTEDQGWNGVGNPTLMHGKVAINAQILDPVSYTYKTITASSAHFTVGTPFFIQAEEDGTMTMVAETSVSLAPARRAAATVDKVKVMLGNADYIDYLYVSASEDATNEYEIGKDLVKMTMTNTPIVPQIFAHAYGTYLCMVNAPMISNEATVALNLYAPAEGEYTLSVEERADATVYLLYNGNIVWNLSMGEYPIHLTQGNNAGYSLVVRRENAPTDVENIFGADEQTEKFIYNGNLYILHEGKVFDAVGNVLK